jgi:hypothetical protein
VPSAFGSTLLPFIFLLVILLTDWWVYRDAKAQTERGSPVYVAFDAFRVDTPVAWFVVCLFLWIIFFPIYLAARGR